MNRKMYSLKNSLVSKRAAQRVNTSIISALEPLESRLFLSGTVLAAIKDGALVLRGDAAANVIVLDQTGLTADQVRVTGTGDTAINGQTAPVILSGITRGVYVRLASGADSVGFSDMSIAGGVSVKDQSGANTLGMDNVQLSENLVVLNGVSLSTTTLTDVTVGSGLEILAQGGKQHVSLQSVEVQGSTKIVSQDSNPIVLTIDDSTFHNAVLLVGSKGADTIQIDSNGNSSGSQTLFDGPVIVQLRGGNDTLQLGIVGQSGNGSVFSGVARFSGGDGFDTLLDFDASTYPGTSRVGKFEANSVAPDITAPTVSSTNPANNDTGIARNRKITATFSEAMNAGTIVPANVVVTAPGNVPVAGTVAYVGTTMTFTPSSLLTANTVYTLTIGTGVTDVAGNALASADVVNFTTGATSDTTAPTVSVTDPTAAAGAVALNKKITATFSEAMDPSTITAAHVTVTGPGAVAVAGTVSYVGNMMTFTPTTNLAPLASYTATITTGATDLAGNALVSNFVWTFTTGAAPDEIAPTVASTKPTNNQTNVFINKTAAATFSEAMDPSTLTTATFTVQGTGGTSVAGSVLYDAPSDTVTFTPSSNLAISTTYTAKILGGTNGAKDLAGNPLAADKAWTFTTGTQIAQAPINLGSANTFAVMATASITSTGATVINGDVGLKPGTSQGIPSNQVNGTVHVNDQAAADAQAALLNAYNDAIGRSTTSIALQGNMGGLTFTPGLYTNSSSVLIQGAGPLNNVTLDAQGDPNAIFIFKMGSTLTTGPGAQVILAGGAKASNVFWQVGTSATLDTTTIFKGSILAAVTITVNNGSAIEGRLLAGSNSSGSATINASTVTVPTP